MHIHIYIHIYCIYIYIYIHILNNICVNKFSLTSREIEKSLDSRYNDKNILTITDGLKLLYNNVIIAPFCARLSTTLR